MLDVRTEDVFRAAEDASGKQWVVFGLDVQLSQDLIPGNLPLVVQADIVRLNGTLATGGRSLTILARQVICGAGAEINTQGAPAMPDYVNGEPRATDGKQPGDPGANGDGGGRGTDGGSVRLVAGEMIGTISIVADGRSGGGAQNGGTGARGLDGENSSVIGGTGGNGGPGGSPGRAGSPGEAGNGGQVSVLAMKVLEDNQVAAKADGGKAGTAAIHGDPGLGGNPGIGRSGETGEYIC